MFVYLIVIKEAQKGGNYCWRSLGQISVHGRVNTKVVPGCSGPCSGKSYTSLIGFISRYGRKSEGATPASTGMSNKNQNPDVHTASINFICSLALVFLLKGERKTA